jgi:hypothetical protein
MLLSPMIRCLSVNVALKHMYSLHRTTSFPTKMLRLCAPTSWRHWNLLYVMLIVFVLLVVCKFPMMISGCAGCAVVLGFQTRQKYLETTFHDRDNESKFTLQCIGTVESCTVYLRYCAVVSFLQTAPTGVRKIQSSLWGTFSLKDEDGVPILHQLRSKPKLVVHTFLSTFWR